MAREFEGVETGKLIQKTDGEARRREREKGEKGGRDQKIRP